MSSARITYKCIYIYIITIYIYIDMDITCLCTRMWQNKIPYATEPNGFQL